MDFGMVGALGGVGAGLSAQGAFLAKQEDADLDQQRKKDLASYNAELQDQILVRQDLRNWANEQERAPTKATMAATTATTMKTAEVKTATDLLPQTSAIEASHALAKETPMDREEKAAKGDLQRSEGEYYRTHAQVLKDTAGAGKLDPVTADRIKSLDEGIKSLTDKITSAKANGNWMDSKDADGKVVHGTDSQRQLETQLAAMQLQRRMLYTTLQPDGPGTKPNVGKAAAAAPGKATGMVGAAPARGSEAAATGNMALTGQPDTEESITQDIAALEGAAKRNDIDSDARDGLRELIDRRRADLETLKRSGSLHTETQPPVVPGAPAVPTAAKPPVKLAPIVPANSAPAAPAAPVALESPDTPAKKQLARNEQFFQKQDASDFTQLQGYADQVTMALKRGDVKSLSALQGDMNFPKLPLGVRLKVTRALAG